MISYNKAEIRNGLTTDNIFDLLLEWGGNPEYTNFGIISSTICHNLPGEGSRKLYFYNNSTLFHCYTGCADPSFDIFELVTKVFKIQRSIDMDLNEAVRYIALRFGIASSEINNDEVYNSEEWKVLDKYDRVKIDIEKGVIQELVPYDRTILSRLNYDVKITPWLNDGIAQSVINDNLIGFYPSTNQITIPHFDKNNNFIGLRGRSIAQSDIEMYGKYRPIKIGKTTYTHPLGLNLYNFNNSKNNIKTAKKTIVYEGEKSCLLHQSYFGKDNDISVACCGSNLSIYQVQLLMEAGAEEIIIAFDRQFQKIGDEEFQHLTKNLTKIHEKYHNYIKISFIFDKKMITSYKASPIDEGENKFLELFKKRIYI